MVIYIYIFSIWWFPEDVPSVACMSNVLLTIAGKYLALISKYCEYCIMTHGLKYIELLLRYIIDISLTNMWHRVSQYFLEHFIVLTWLETLSTSFQGFLFLGSSDNIDNVAQHQSMAIKLRLLLGIFQIKIKFLAYSLVLNTSRCILENLAVCFHWQFCASSEEVSKLTESTESNKWNLVKKNWNINTGIPVFFHNNLQKEKKTNKKNSHKSQPQIPERFYSLGSFWF